MDFRQIWRSNLNHISSNIMRFGKFKFFWTKFHFYTQVINLHFLAKILEKYHVNSIITIENEPINDLVSISKKIKESKSKMSF